MRYRKQFDGQYNKDLEFESILEYVKPARVYRRRESQGSLMNTLVDCLKKIESYYGIQITLVRRPSRRSIDGVVD